MPKSCRDLVTYFARYAATRRGESRVAVVRAEQLVVGSFAAVVVSGVNGWVSIWAPNRSARTAPWSGSLSPVATSILMRRAACWIRAASSVEVIGDDQSVCWSTIGRGSPPPHGAAGP